MGEQATRQSPILLVSLDVFQTGNADDGLNPKRLSPVILSLAYIISVYVAETVV